MNSSALISFTRARWDTGEPPLRWLRRSLKRYATLLDREWLTLASRNASKKPSDDGKDEENNSYPEEEVHCFDKTADDSEDNSDNDDDGK